MQMATKPSQMPTTPTTTTPAPSEAELHAAFKTRAQRIVDSLNVQLSNAEKLLKTKKAKASPAQEAAFRTALEGARTRLGGVIAGKPATATGGIPDQ